jgi:uncharacterized damage-inducible protein DinB
MNSKEIGLLIDYHYWARDRVLDAVAPLTSEKLTRDLGNSFRSIHETLTHLYAAEWIWYQRWQGEAPTSLLPANTFADLAALTAGWRDMEAKMRKFVAAQDDAALARTMSYKLVNGQSSANVVWQMIQHVVNHGSYHRGQITTMLRQLGEAPGKSMDLIAFYRERA